MDSNSVAQRKILILSFIFILETWNKRLGASVHPHLRDKRADLVLDLHQTTETTLHNGGKVKQPQRVTGGRGVEDHHGEVHSFH